MPSSTDPVHHLHRWGTPGERYDPPPPLLRWLGERLGPADPLPAPAGPGAFSPPPPRRLPRLPGELRDEPLDRLAHCRGKGFPDLIRLRAGQVPAVADAVARPAGDGELEKLLKRCSLSGIRVVPWGGGTSVTGGVNLVPERRPAVVVDLERLAGLERLDAASGLATFGAGTRGPALESALAAEDLTLGHFPQSFELSTLGGWVATRASGQESLGYGSIADLVAGLDLVAPGGRLELPAFPASAAGPDLRHLVLGSEGRLGVVARATVRVRPRPAGRAAAGFLLPGWEEGLAAVRDLLGDGVPLTLLRLSDAPETEVAMTLGLAEHRALAPLVGAWRRLRGVGAGACLLLAGAAGDEPEIDAALVRAGEVVRRRGAVGLGRRPGRRWLADRFRHPYLRDALLDRGYATDTLETATPWTRLPELATAVGEAIEGALEGDGEPVAALCHVSHPYPDGASLYFTFFFRCPDEPEWALARWATVKRRASEAIVAGGGTISHHHGVGQWHAPWLDAELGRGGRKVLESASLALDPEGVLNPHALLDPEDRLEH